MNLVEYNLDVMLEFIFKRDEIYLKCIWGWKRVKKKEKEKKEIEWEGEKKTEKTFVLLFVIINWNYSNWNNNLFLNSNKVSSNYRHKQGGKGNYPSVEFEEKNDFFFKFPSDFIN